MIRFDQNLVTDVALVKEYPVDRTFTHPLSQAKLLLCTQTRAASTQTKLACVVPPLHV